MIMACIFICLVHVYKNVKPEVNMKIERAKEEPKYKLVAKLENRQLSPRTFWSVAKEFYGNKTKNTIPTLVENGRHHSTAVQKVNLLTKYFASQSQKPILPPDYTELLLENVPGIDNINISEEEVYTILRKLQTDKAAGKEIITQCHCC